jgi:hypothetical protein
VTGTLFLLIDRFWQAALLGSLGVWREPNVARGSGAHACSENGHARAFRVEEVTSMLKVNIVRVDVSAKNAQKKTDYVAEEEPLHIFLNRTRYLTVFLSTFKAEGNGGWTRYF